MIKANYVRVNNYVSYKGNIITVVPKTIDDIGFQQSLNSEFYTGIPITEEWLLKLGFKLSCIASDKYNAPDDAQHYHIIKHDNKYIFRGLGASVVEVKTVHHLQNLYFALTGKELTL